MDKPADFTERRKSPRFSRTISVQVQSDRHEVSAGLVQDSPGVNIGLGGICFISQGPYAVGDELDMMIRIADWDPEARRRSLYIAVSSIPYAAAGAVVRCEELADKSGFEVGVRFTDISDGDRKALERYLEA